jgi:endonuclease/exonuclease/phosphatase family metal-dependent hydrolase
MQRGVMLAWVLAVGCALQGDGTGAGTSVDGAAPAADARADGGNGADWEPAPIQVPEGPLCDIPAGYVEMGGDPTNIDCQIEADRLTDRDPTSVPAQLKVVAWNIEFGAASATIEHELRTRPQLADADFLLLSEVARHNLQSNPQRIDQARALATALRMDYVFAVEWDRREKPDELGEHGVAILSKYPLGNVTQIRHTPLNDWYGSEQLYGGRISLAVDADVGGRRIRLYASHLCTRGVGDTGRAMQAAEARADADAPGRPSAQVFGGDLNTWTCNPGLADCTRPPAAEATIEDFLAEGWADATAGFEGSTHVGAGFFPQRLDWIFARGIDVDPGTRVDAEGSDHFPLYTRLD